MEGIPTREMSGGMTTMGLQDLSYMQKIFPAFIGSAIRVAALAHVLNQLLYRQRMSALNIALKAAKSRSFFFKKGHATISVVV
jgi:hypothetical protein